ncbi:hypothetical protein BKA81DRAFT_402725 [Phyllosticta paracitricarpa]|uniref:BTB domain-containing protein n=2 Tax=Phyllosticta TaxID=121621 RepID=A0ABR1MJQ9_9PEZI
MAGDDDSPRPPKFMRDLLESGLFSDLKIRCRDGTVYNVHKNILYTQSQFFKNALNPTSNFLEAQSNTFKHENDDPVTVKALIEYFYCYTYIEAIEGLPGGLLLFHTQVYAIGEKYRVQGLKDLASARFKEVYDEADDFDDMDFTKVVETVYSTTPQMTLAHATLLSR